MPCGCRSSGRGPLSIVLMALPGSGRPSLPARAEPEVAVRPELDAQGAAGELVLAPLLQQIVDPGDVVADVELRGRRLGPQVVDDEHGGSLPVGAVREQRRRLVLQEGARAEAELGDVAPLSDQA